MSDTETIPSDAFEQTTEDVEEIPDEKPAKTAKGKMTETKLKNLEKARAARRQNLDAKKYSKDNRTAAEMRADEEIQRRAEELAEKKAEELLERKRQEAELAEYREWKKEQEKLQKEKDLKRKKAKKTKDDTELDVKPKAKPRKKVAKAASEGDEDSEAEVKPKRKVVRKKKAAVVEQEEDSPEQTPQQFYTPQKSQNDWINNMLD
ncbi:hypothetical protein HK097_007370 [Rhizophlyctis rosea]|uniref:Uncharacterized protein n=1 Tax=Rhizophlyctis rosea TaxID=64517 RepID=A0AAD5SJM5_9FUNG|nr:hypothetical protein HK097_007370 [Rhizophlyctis rosea]